MIFETILTHAKLCIQIVRWRIHEFNFLPAFKVDATFVNRVDIMFFFSDMYFDSLETM